MSESGEVNVGAIISLTAPDDGNVVWRAQQINVARNLPPEDDYRHPFEWSYGPIKTTGYLDTNTFEIGVSTSILGIDVGNIYGNLKDGVGLSISLSAAKGSINWFFKNGNELWTQLDVRTRPDGTFSGDFKIFTIKSRAQTWI